MHKVISSIALVAFLTAPATAQTSAAARAQQLEKLEEDLNSADPNLRLAALEVAMESGTLALKSRALSIGLTSSDETLRNLAFSYKICQLSEIAVVMPRARYASESYKGFSGGMALIKLGGCDPQTGRMTARLPVETFDRFSPSSSKVGTGTISGGLLRLTIPTEYGHSQKSVSCSIELKLDSPLQLVGLVACSGSGGDNFGPGQALAKLN